MPTHAISKYLRLSTHKARRVLLQIQGKKYLEAKLILQFMPYRACKPILKTLESAVNNYTYNNNNIRLEDIFIKTAIADQGPTLRRFQPRAQGRGFPIRKPTCHIAITVDT